MLSATTFTLVGVVNKFLTVLVNVIIWDKHSSTVGLFAVSICLIAGIFYEQAPRRSELQPKQELETRKDTTFLAKNEEEMELEKLIPTTRIDNDNNKV
jgi:hypothetical protein